jgi:hypothetical protein
MGTIIAVRTELETVQCGVCGGLYAICAKYKEKKREEGGFWNCPYCKTSWGYNKEGTELEKSRREAESLRNRLTREMQSHDQTRAELDYTERRRRAEKAAKTRIQNRVKAGVCPCCKRSFANLREHMKDKHPDYPHKEA